MIDKLIIKININAVLRRDKFDEREQDYYEALYTQTQAQFGTYVQTGTVLNNYAHIFDLLIRLRQAVNHPYLVVYSNTAAANAAKAAAALLENTSNQNNKGKQPLLSLEQGDIPAAVDGIDHQSSGGNICGICRDPLEDPVASLCGHAFCRLCAQEYMGSITGTGATCDCPVCSKPLTLDLSGGGGRYNGAGGSNREGASGSGTTRSMSTSAVINSSTSRKTQGGILSRINLSNFQSSTKIEALREELEKMVAMDPSAKAIVFSQFVNMLVRCDFALLLIIIIVFVLSFLSSMIFTSI